MHMTLIGLEDGHIPPPAVVHHLGRIEERESEEKKGYREDGAGSPRPIRTTVEEGDDGDAGEYHPDRQRP